MNSKTNVNANSRSAFGNRSSNKTHRNFRANDTSGDVFRREASERACQNMCSAFQTTRTDNRPKGVENLAATQSLGVSKANENQSFSRLQSPNQSEIAPTDQPRNFLENVGEFFKNLVGGLVNVVKQVLPVLSAVAMFVPGLQVVALVSKGAELLDSFVRGDLFGMVKGIAGFLTGGAADLIGRGADYLQKGLNLFKDFTDLMNGSGNLLDFLKESLSFLGGFAQGAFAKTVETASFWVDKTDDFLGGIYEFMSGNISGFLQFGLNFSNGIAQGDFGQFVKDAKDFVGGGWSRFFAENFRR